MISFEVTFEHPKLLATPHHKSFEQMQVLTGWLRPFALAAAKLARLAKVHAFGGSARYRDPSRRDDRNYSLQNH